MPVDPVQRVQIVSDASALLKRAERDLATALQLLHAAKMRDAGDRCAEACRLVREVLECHPELLLGPH